MWRYLDMPEYTVHGKMWVSMTVNAEDKAEAKEIYENADFDDIIENAHTFTHDRTDEIEED
jgi:hypothetical protein